MKKIQENQVHSENYLTLVKDIADQIDSVEIDKMAIELASLREHGGRLFIMGVGGSAANASHAVNDFRKLCEIEAYCPSDNVSELTARTNDEGWETVFIEWLRVSKANEKDAILIFSVGGGDQLNNVSVNLVKAVEYSKQNGLKVFGIVGKKEGFTQQHGDLVIVVPAEETGLTTPIAEAFQGIIWHCLVSHPALQVNETKWQSLEEKL